MCNKSGSFSAPSVAKKSRHEAAQILLIFLFFLRRRRSAQIGTLRRSKNYSLALDKWHQKRGKKGRESEKIEIRLDMPYVQCTCSQNPALSHTFDKKVGEVSVAPWRRLQTF